MRLKRRRRGPVWLLPVVGLALAVALYNSSAQAQDPYAFPVGQSYLADFGDRTFQLYFASEDQLKYSGVSGLALGEENTVSITASRFRDGIYIVSWQESDGTTVVEVLDFELLNAFMTATSPDGAFLNVSGKLIPSDAQPAPLAGNPRLKYHAQRQ